ncbi:hypothetical protein THAOC_25822 [Thalassiosira oceanica]|uniref:Amine oxidase domain-containing protein n=1 Tax=Thalassiosira oceanica TaxID=159749 RepID=K0RN21_THAOC|nr:hypothetical protein THAOC_25822 [Thalassiosira oceanica]|eukprot:EJK54540.1 hypothetical protein THAOC_25822 [Thalassiosira oceanica]
MRLPILLGLLICLCVGAFRSSLHLTAPPRSRPRRLRSSHCATNTDNEEWDVVVIGAGVGGLCAAAMCQRYGMKTLCLEAHEHAGGVAHSFERRAKAGTFKFDSGPSLLSGMSSMGTNPLRQAMS